ncbi:MAG TPA: aminotransferase class III-fold pyridoxal phosphate-dependent enzyme, partial [Polyangia bacterium]|nr:aminotransferase class III-fold pyridoxal phosphate-dependent enzyme [Polyangia bacterium]
PVTGVISTDEISRSEPWAKPSGASSSYGGNPLAATAALATLETILDEKLVERSATVGEEMKRKLRALQEKYEFIGDVRGVGLMIGVELATPELAGAVAQLCFKRGLLLLECGKKSIRFSPPLIITEAQANVAADVFAAACHDTRHE